MRGECSYSIIPGQTENGVSKKQKPFCFFLLFFALIIALSHICTNCDDHGTAAEYMAACCCSSFRGSCACARIQHPSCNEHFLVIGCIHSHHFCGRCCGCDNLSECNCCTCSQRLLRFASSVAVFCSGFSAQSDPTHTTLCSKRQCF